MHAIAKFVEMAPAYAVAHPGVACLAGIGVVLVLGSVARLLLGLPGPKNVDSR